MPMIRRAHRRHTVGLSIALATSIFGGATALHAQEAAPPDQAAHAASRVVRQQHAPPPVPSQPLPAVLPPAAAGTEPVLASFRVERIVISGNTAIADTTLGALTGPYLGRTVTADDLEDLRRRLTEAYITRGFISSGAILPDQNVENGTVTYKIVEGRVSDIEVSGTGWLRPEYVRDRLARSVGPPVNINDIQSRVQLLLQDPAISQINAELTPDVAPGEAKLLAKVAEAKPYSLTATIANDEPPDVGSIRGSLTGVIRNIAGFGDALAMTYGRTEGANLGNVTYAIPVTTHDTTVTTHYDYNGAGVVSDAFKGLGVSSRTQSAGIGVSQPVWRTPQQSVNVSLGIDYTASTTYLLGQPFTFAAGAKNGEADSTALRLTIDGIDRSAEQVVALRSTLSHGLDLFGVTDQAKPPNADFTVWLGQAQYVRNIIGTSQLIVRADAQLSSTALFPFEQIAIGGPNTVRGYGQNTLVRDNGVIASLEMRIPIAVLQVPYLGDAEGAGTVRVVPFADYGAGWNHHRTPQTPTPVPHSISSIGIGLRWDVSSRVSAQIYYGYGLTRVHTDGRDLQVNGITFSLTSQIF